MIILYVLTLFPLSILFLTLFLTITYFWAGQEAKKDSIPIWWKLSWFLLVMVFCLVLIGFIALFIYGLAGLMKL